MFGSNSVFGQSQPQQNMFGQTPANNNSGFGFGQQQQQPQQQSVFGAAPSGQQTGFGATNTFGSGSTFGQAKPAFGASTGSVFGGSQPTNNSPFGTSTGFGASSSGFGSSTSGGFGQKPAASGGLFSSTAPAFGSSGGSVFGSTSSGFGQQQPQTQRPQGSMFGNSSTSIPGGNQGTGQPPYAVTHEKEGTNSTLSVFQAISAMTAYRNFSFEELRFQDYSVGKKFSSGTAGTGGGFGVSNTFGTTGGGFGSSSTGFGSSSAFGSSNTGFGSQPQQNSMFGSSTAQPTTSAPGGLFGSTGGTGTSLFNSNTSNSAFGSNTTTSAFGQPSNNAFGQPASQPNNNAFGQPANNAFGQPAGKATGAFGQPSNTTQPSAFGQPSNNQTSTFAQSTNSAFGQQPATTGFGQASTTSAFGQPSTGGFGQTNNQATGAFGQNNNTLQNKPFGFGASSTTNTFVAAANTTTQPFGASSNTSLGFGAKPATTSTFGFGNQQQQSTTSTSLFGSNQPAATSTTGGLFGSTQPAGGGLFGNKNANTGFGTQPAATGAFGAQPAQNTSTSLFGSSTGLFSNTASTGFGQPAAATGTSLFGTKPAGTFGQPTSTLGLGTGTGLFSTGVGIGGLGATQQPGLQASIDKNPYGVAYVANKEKPAVDAPPKKNSALTPHYKVTPRNANRMKLRGFSPSPLTAVGKHGLTDSKKLMIYDNSVKDGLGLDSRFHPRASVKKLVIRDVNEPLFSPGKKGPLFGTPASQSKLSTGKVKVSFDPLLEEEAFTKLKDQTVGVQVQEDDDEEFTKTPSKMKNTIVPTTIKKSTPVKTSPVVEKIASPVKSPAKTNEYIINPSLEDLMKMSDEELQSVEDFEICLPRYGSVRFLSPVNLLEVVKSRQDIGDIPGKLVIFTPKNCSVYPDESLRPKVGVGLNLPAEIRLLGCWPVDKSTKTPIMDEQDPRYDRHLQKLEEKSDTVFLGFQVATGTWRFRVEHF